MFGSFSPNASAYAQVGVQTGVASASPHQLITMLYDALCQQLLVAGDAITAKQVSRKGEALSKAVRILEDGLRASLDCDRGGNIALQLDSLYEYMVSRLLTANLHSDIHAVEEVSRLVGELREAWQAMPTAEMI